MIKFTSQNKNTFVLQGQFSESKIDANVVQETNHITEFISKKKAVIFLGEKNEFSEKKLVDAFKKIITANHREYQIDVKSFTSAKVFEENVVKQLIYTSEFNHGLIYNMHSKAKTVYKKLTAFNYDKKLTKHISKAHILSSAVTYTRDLQIMPPNVLNSVYYANKIKRNFANNKNIAVKILNKTQIESNKMGLLLSVNKGSAYEPRVVIMEYKGNKGSSEKVVVVGKGITFDSGGYSLKPSKPMMGMKYDMSGSAVVAGMMRAISELKPKSNVVGILVLTDNMVGPKASTPDAVYKAMNGKSVEVNNTDAEGRLALADGLTYGAKVLKASRLIDVATLTGAIVSALGSTYTGVWSTSEKGWKDIKIAAQKASENVWRMPLHEEYAKYIKDSKVADLKNTDLTGKGGSSSAAMFLKEFTEGVEYLHFDIAGVADIKEVPMGTMVRTLYELTSEQ